MTEVRGIQSVGAEAQGIQFAGVAVPGSQWVGVGIPSDEVEIQSAVVGILSTVHPYPYLGAGSCWLGSEHQSLRVRERFAVKVVGVAPC